MIFTFGNLIIFSLVFLLSLLIKYPNRAIGTKKRNDPSFSEIPGWPLIGALPAVMKNRARVLEFLTNNGLKYGLGFSFTLPGLRVVDISKPEWIEYIQKTNFENYVKSLLFQPMWDVFGQGIFMTDGTVWKRSRHAISTIFTNKTFKTIIEPHTEKSLDGLTKELQAAAEENGSIDFCHLFHRFTLDSFVGMTFGKDLGIVGTEYSDQSGLGPAKATYSATSFVKAFDFAQDQMDFRMAVLSGWKLMEALNGSGEQMKRSCRVIDDFAYSLIDERISQSSHKVSSEDEESSSKDLLALFMNARDERGGGLGRIELRDTAMNLIFAGRDTTAQTLSWAFFHLLMNKGLISKVREEGNDILGEGEGSRRGVTYANHKKFLWSHAVVLETLRLHPSVPKNGKIALSDDKIPGGPLIQAGDMVRWSDWKMGRDAGIWGPDCAEFKPDRWIDEKGSMKQFGQFKFHAFNGGPRICLGMNLAIFEAVKVIVEVFKSFELEFADGWLENVPKSEFIEGITGSYRVPKYKASITLPMENPMMISVRNYGA
ncbi:Cytochrome P450 52A3 [Puccinia graminis f. sp. tritici]|uniref:Cytochrome P450 52A3 n=2 Tax=Puccinia graminis f. sp. tritici TaxID=56615 RepID=A0A5B0NIR3_PUCGR|nr:Cytochrome P450 52A3 [Puccinia graminis f. sp. tritici]